MIFAALICVICYNGFIKTDSNNKVIVYGLARLYPQFAYLRPVGSLGREFAGGSILIRSKRIHNAAAISMVDLVYGVPKHILIIKSERKSCLFLYRHE